MTSALGDTIDSREGNVPWPGLDDADLRLIRALQEDGRASIARLAKVTEQSVPATRQRYERLTGRGLVTAVAVVDPAAVGRRVIAHLEIGVRGDVQAVRARLQALPEVAWMAVGSDYQTIRVQVSTDSNAGLVSLLNREIRALPGVHSLASSILLRSWSPVFNFGGGTPAPRGGPGPHALWHGDGQSPRTLDDIDVVLLRRLEQDARSTITSMAERVGLSVPATRQRLVKFLRDGTLRVRIRPNPLAEGITPVGLVVSFDGDSTQIAEQVAALPNVTYVLEATGPATIRVELLCAHEGQVAEAHLRAGAVPGVTGVQIVRHGTVVVHTGHW